MKPSFLKDTMVIFAVDILVLITYAYFLGDYAKEASTMFQLGSKGLALETMLQYFLSAAVIAGWRQVFFTERIFKHMMTLWRTVGMLTAVFLSISCFIVGFKWFPADDVRGWSGFIISFFLCFAVSMGMMIFITKWQSRKYGRLLKEYQKGEEHAERK